MHRTQKKNVRKKAALLKRIREHPDLSMPQVAEMIGKSVSWISNVENGRIDVTDDRIKLLLPLYGQTEKRFESYLSGKALVDRAYPKRCEGPRMSHRVSG